MDSQIMIKSINFNELIDSKSIKKINYSFSYIFN